nr:tyrosine-type recombinase/integrase [Halobacillus andaensis]
MIRNVEVYFNIRYDIWLKRYIQERMDDDQSLFVTERDPHRMSIAQMRYLNKRISKSAGIDKTIHPHQLRHYVELGITGSKTKLNRCMRIR